MRQAMQAMKQAMSRLWQKLTKRLPLLRRKKNPSANNAATPELTLKRGAVYKAVLATAAVALAAVMLFAMTAAWYKNVVQTSGLLFHVDQWGLDSSVSIQEDLIGARPGSSGLINLSVDNTSDGIISVTLNVSKGDLSACIADMSKRLYFYIDDMAYRGGEHTPRVYLNSAEVYSYTVLPEQNLVLGDNGNGAPLRWEWVLDVVGYYFYGTVTDATTATVKEYLRPVEYVLDKATFHDGILTTVDGTTTPAAFIEALSEEDGFEGTVTTTVTASDGKIYYPVSVDPESGEGVWIYLCDLGEIERETLADTEMGSAEADADRQFEAYLHVTAQQKQLTVVEVSTEAQLKEALTDNVHNLVQIAGNVVLTEPLTVSGTSEKILDMEGHTISTDAARIAVIQEGASLTVMDGTLQGAGTSSCYGVVVEGGDVAMSNVTITDASYGLRVCDDAASRNDSRVTLTGCEVHASSAGVFVKGNGPVTAADTCVVIEDCLIESTGYYALVGNGTVGAKGNYGTDICVRNSTLRAPYTAIYHPQRDSRLAVEGSTLEAQTALVVKGGDVVVTDTVLHAVEKPELEEEISEPSFNNSGFAAVASAVYVETGYNYPCSVTIDGDCTVTSFYVDTPIIFYEDTNPLYRVTVTGGKYSHDVSAFLDEGYTCTKEGAYWVVKGAE